MGSLFSVGGIGERNVAQLARGDDYLSWNATHLTPVPGQCQLPQKWCNQHQGRTLLRHRTSSTNEGPAIYVDRVAHHDFQVGEGTSHSVFQDWHLRQI